jgi:hypothetical protein
MALHVGGLQIMKTKINSSSLMLGLFITLLSAPSGLSQNQNRIVQWPEIITRVLNTSGSGYSQELAEIDALEIMDIAVSGKSITIGQSFAADDEWLKNLTVRVKNVSSLTISSVQMDLFLPEIMPGGPLVTLCFGCGGVAKGQTIMPGEEVELKLVLYSWLLDQINRKSSLSMITKAEIREFVYTLPDSRKWLTRCLKTASLKNACPTTAP